MTYLPEVRDALATAVSQNSPERRRPGRRRFERTLARSAVALTVLVSLAIAVVVVVSVHGTGPHASAQTAGASGRIPLAWRQDRLTAMNLVGRRDRGCSVQVAAPTPRRQTILDVKPPTSLSSLLAVLRRPAPAGVAVSLAQLRQLRRGHLGVPLDAQGIYLRYARQGRVDGVRYYLIPVEHIEPNALPSRCFSEQSTAFTHLAATLPVSQRRAAIGFEAARLRAARGPQPPGVVLITTDTGGSGSSYLPVTALRRNPYTRSGSSGSDKITETVLLLPNDVATVTARYSRQTYPGRVPTPITITRPVKDNLVLLVFRGAWDPPSLTYRSATGKVLWTNRQR